ncbi:hypothetical protein HDV00_005238 [Rhizophlyctis rosea]|nr:hypothetical protein HDV00_005238 [Rhizophlyctis rosea]
MDNLLPVRPKRSIRRTQGLSAQLPPTTSPYRTQLTTRLSSPPTVYSSHTLPTTTTYTPPSPTRPRSVAVTVEDLPRPLSFAGDEKTLWGERYPEAKVDAMGKSDRFGVSDKGVVVGIGVGGGGGGSLKRGASDVRRNVSGRSFGLVRTLSRISQRSYGSNLSRVRRRDYLRFGRSKVAFLVFDTLERIDGSHINIKLSDKTDPTKLPIHQFIFVAIAVLLFTSFTWSNRYTESDVIRIFEPALLICITILGVVMAIVGALGYIGAFAHKKLAIGVHAVLLWPVVLAAIVLGFWAYKTLHNSGLENNLSDKWDLAGVGRGQIQLQLTCCGYFSELDRPYTDELCEGYVNTGNTTTIAPTILKARAGAWTVQPVNATKTPPPQPAAKPPSPSPAPPKPSPSPVSPSSPPSPSPAIPSAPSPPSSPSSSPPSPPLAAASPPPSTTLPTPTPDADESTIPTFEPQEDQFLGCHDAWLGLVTKYLKGVYIGAFSIIPLCLVMFVVSVLAGNHIYD